MGNMRRKEKAMKPEEAVAILAKGEYGVLSTCGHDGKPYGVPLNYVYRDHCIYFHCAPSGYKIQRITENPKVSFCVVGETRLLPSDFSTEYQSVIASGTASAVEGQEQRNALQWLVEKYSPRYMDEGMQYIERHGPATRVIRIRIEKISGKQSPADQL